MVSLSNWCNFSRSPCKLLNGSSSWFTAACWFDWLLLDFLKQLTMVSFDTAFHDDAKCFVPWRILIFGSGLLLSTALIQRLTTFFRWWLWDFVLHSGPLVEEQTLYLEAGKSGWCSWGSWFQDEQGNCQSEGQPFCFELERMSRAFLLSLQIKLLSSIFFLRSVSAGKLLYILKHRGFLDLPITNISNVFPVALTATMLSILLYCSYLQNTFLQIGGKS